MVKYEIEKLQDFDLYKIVKIEADGSRKVLGDKPFTLDEAVSLWKLMQPKFKVGDVLEYIGGGMVSNRQ